MNAFGPMNYFLTTACVCLGGGGPPKTLLNLSSSPFCKDLSSPPSLCSETFCSDYRDISLSIVSVCLFFFFHLTPFLLFCRRAQYVIMQSRYCWQGVTFRWECTMALQVTFIHYQPKIMVKYSAQVLICVTRVVTVELQSNLQSLR